jgi:hypothetical protein
MLEVRRGRKGLKGRNSNMVEEDGNNLNYDFHLSIKGVSVFVSSSLLQK